MKRKITTVSAVIAITVALIVFCNMLKNLRSDNLKFESDVIAAFWNYNDKIDDISVIGSSVTVYVNKDVSKEFTDKLFAITQDCAKKYDIRYYSLSIYSTDQKLIEHYPK